MGLKGIELRHPAEAYARVGIRWYSDGVIEPYLIDTGQPLDICSVAVRAKAGMEEVLLDATLPVQAVEWVEAAGPVATLVDHEAGQEGG